MWHYTSSLHLLWLASLRGQSHVIKSSRCLFHTGVSRVLRNSCVPGKGDFRHPSGTGRGAKPGREAGERNVRTPGTSDSTERERGRDRHSWALGSPFLGLGRQLKRGGPSQRSWVVSGPEAGPGAPAHSPHTAAKGGHGTAPRMSPGCTLEGATTKEHTQGTAHISGPCGDTPNSLGRSPVHIQSIQSCRQTACPNSWLAKSQHSLPPRAKSLAGISLLLVSKTCQAFGSLSRGGHQHLLPVGWWWVPSGMWALAVGGPAGGGGLILAQQEHQGAVPGCAPGVPNQGLRQAQARSTGCPF